MLSLLSEKTGRAAAKRAVVNHKAIVAPSLLILHAIENSNCPAQVIAANNFYRHKTFAGKAYTFKTIVQECAGLINIAALNKFFFIHAATAFVSRSTHCLSCAFSFSSSFILQKRMLL
jgi:hypothetical protein